MRQQHYRFAHQVLMGAVLRNPDAWWGGAESHGTAMIQQSWAAAGAGLAPEEMADGSAMTLRHAVLGPGVESWVVTLPSPQAPTEAFFVALVKLGSTPPRYFVAERGMNEQNGAPRAYWAEWKQAPGGGPMRVRGADLPSTDLESFLAAAVDECRASQAIPAGHWAAPTGGGGGPFGPFPVQGRPPQKKSRVGLIVGLVAVGFFLFVVSFGGFLLYEEEGRGLHVPDSEVASVPVEPGKPFTIEFSWSGIGWTFNNIWLVVEDGQKSGGKFKAQGQLQCDRNDREKEVKADLAGGYVYQIESKGPDGFSAWFYLEDEYEHGNGRTITCKGLLVPQTGTFTKAHIAVTQRQRPSDFFAF